MKYLSVYKLVLRICVAIPFLAIILICAFIGSIRTWIMFIRFGGEHIVYSEDDIASMHKIYNQIKQN